MAAAFASFLTGLLQCCLVLRGMDSRVRLPRSSVSVATKGIFNKLLIPYCLLGPNLASYLAVAKKKKKKIKRKKEWMKILLEPFSTSGSMFLPTKDKSCLSPQPSTLTKKGKGKIVS